MGEKGEKKTEEKKTEEKRRKEKGRRAAIRKGRGRIWGGVAAALLLFIYGCGNPTEDTGNSTGEKGEQEYAYTAKHQSLNEYCESISAVMPGNEGKVYFTGVRDNRDMLYVLDIDGAEGNNVKEYPLETEQGMHISVIGKDAGGNLLLGVIAYQGGAASGGAVEGVFIKKLSPEGEIMESVDTGNRFSGKDAGSFYINGLYQDSEGNYYISTSQEVCVLYPDGSIYFAAPTEDYITTFFVMEDGRAVVGYGGKNNWRLEAVDLLQEALKPLESSVEFAKGVYRGGTDKALVYTKDGGLYACDLTDEEPDVLLNWADCGINSNNIQDFMILPDGRIISVTVDYSAGAARELSVLTKTEPSKMPKKTILTYAAVYVPYYTERDIVEFNKQSDKYYIEIKVYGDDTMEYNDRIALLNADLADGQIDIIDMSVGGLSLENLVSSGAAEDLAPYFEGDDAVDREDFPESVMEAYERDGKLYAVMSSFGMETLAGRTTDVGGGSTWSAEEMMTLSDKWKGAELLESADKGTVLWLICRLNEGLFIDRENGSCDFTGEDFGKYLEFANRFPANTDYESGGDSETERIEKIRNGKLLLLNCMVTSVEAYQLYEYEFGEPVNFIGYPTTGAGGHILKPQGTTAAMHSASEHKEGVWEFIRFCLSEERQEKLNAINGDGFPVRKTALDKLLREEMEEAYYEDEDGNRKIRPKNTWAVGELNIDVYAATREQVDGIQRMIETARMGLGMDDKVFEIIYEEAEAYFSGIRSADKAAELIQNRVQTYLNER